MIVGIDLGTTNSLVAFMATDGPQLIPNALGDVLTPSVVGIDEQGRVLVGRVAREYRVLKPDRCASQFKRYMGTDWSCSIGGQKFSAVELSALVLKSLKADAEAACNETVDRAVITVPAYFNDRQRKDTIRAGELAGLKVERILNEPTAAAIAYGLHEAGSEKTIVVFDLGGGTFDVSVVELFEGAVEVKSSSGECFLGGEDFTRALAAKILEQKGLHFEHAEQKQPLLVARLLQICEATKRTLSRDESCEVRIPHADGTLDEKCVSLTVTREQFALWTQHILERTSNPVQRSLGDARLKRSDIDEVLLVGGATRMPSVIAYVEKLLGMNAKCRLNPDEVVALGAAVQAGLFDQNASLNDVVVTDVCPFTLGVEISKQLGQDFRNGYFLAVINRNTTIPVSRVETVSTLTPNQDMVRVRVYQGESRRVEENLALGEFELRGIPRGPAGQPIDIRFTYDLNGVLEVEATIKQTGRKASLVITSHMKQLSSQELRDAVLNMAKLKIHPRDEAQNQFVLRRAERLYTELSLDLRQRLDELLTAFEQVMAMQEPGPIAEVRSALEQFLSAFDRDETADSEWQKGDKDV